EDGIRDFHVTGVQTCALPIYKYLTLTVSTNMRLLRSLVCFCHRCTDYIMYIKFALMNECDATNIGHLRRLLLRSLVFLPQMHGLYNVNMIYKICTDE